MKETTVAVAQAAIAQEAVLPARVQEALGELVGAAREGLLALGVGVGLGVMSELMAEEVDEVVGPKGKHNPERTAVRHGHEAGEVTLGGGRVAVQRPRVRTADGSEEVTLETYRHFADRDPLTRFGSLEEVRADVERYRESGITELFLDLNFDERVAAPGADPDAALGVARRLLAALAASG